MEIFGTIEKKDNISYQDFIEQYVKTGTPVVFKNASGAWKSNKIFTPDYFRENFGQHETTFEGQKYKMTDILDLTAKSNAENPAPYPILFEIPQQIPKLMELFDPIHMNYSQPNWLRSKIIPYGKYGNNIHLFIGGDGNKYGLHKDFYHTNAWITQLYGEKRFIVYPGDQDKSFYIGKSGYEKFLSPVDIHNPDYEKFPEFKHAKAYDVVLQPGETIFIPNGVLHTTMAFGQNISLIYDQLNSLNYKKWKEDMYDLKKDESKIKAAVHYAFALTAGTICRAGELVGKKF